MYEYQAEVVNIVDADTLDLLVDVGFRHHMRDRFRLWGVDAYEQHGKRGRKATAAVEALLEACGSAVTIQTHKDEQGKYGRWLADVWLADGTHLNEWLVSQGHAVRYPSSH